MLAKRLGLNVNISADLDISGVISAKLIRLTDSWWELHADRDIVESLLFNV